MLSGLEMQNWAIRILPTRNQIDTVLWYSGKNHIMNMLSGLEMQNWAIRILLTRNQTWLDKAWLALNRYLSG